MKNKDDVIDLRSAEVFASIQNRFIWIVGWPHSGWRGATADEKGAKEILFGFNITDDGAGNFLLISLSVDGVFNADSWHESIEEAYASAERCFGIRRSEWNQSKPK